MPARNEGGSANPVGSLRTREKARPAVRKHQKNRGSVTAARACAARLMAPGAALEILRLSRGTLDPFCPAGDRKSFLLARTLLLTGIGDAQDWQDSHGTPFNSWSARSSERWNRSSTRHFRWRISTSRRTAQSTVSATPSFTCVSRLQPKQFRWICFRHAIDVYRWHTLARQILIHSQQTVRVQRIGGLA